MHRILPAVVAVLALAGCVATPSADPTQPPPLTSSAVPVGGTTLRELGFVHGPDGFSVPFGATLEERVDSPNNITVVMTTPDELTLAAYYRQALPELGFTITADERNSLLFEGDGYQGAFTSANGYSAVTLRTDR